jgi:hypothetical protein
VTKEEYNPEEPIDDAKHELFCEYVGRMGMPYTKAYRDAVSNKATWATCGTAGSRLMQKDRIRARVKYWQEVRKEEVRNSAFELEHYLKELLKLPISDYFEVKDEELIFRDGVALSDLPYEFSQYITGVEQTKHGIKVNLINKAVAIQYYASLNQADSIHQVHILGTSELGEDL